MLIASEGHRLRAADLGRGAPLLLHGGWIASWDLWLPLIERLQHEWRCIAYDHRGAGASTVPIEEITATALVDDVFGALDAAGIDRCVIAGESIGCLVAEQAVLRDPSRFGGLVLVGGPTRGLVVSAENTRRLRADYPGYIDAFVRACTPEVEGPDAAALRAWGRATLLPAGPDAAAAMTAAHAEIAPAFEHIPVPTLVVHGALDRIVPVDAGREAAARIPGAELVVIDDAGHLPIFTRPHLVADAIAQWWTRVAS